MTYVQTICPVQHDTRQKTRPAAMISVQMPQKAHAFSWRWNLKARAMTTRKNAAIRTPAATSAGLTPFMPRNVVALTNFVKETRNAA